MEIKSIKTFIIFILAFVGINSLFIKMSNEKAIIMAVILYFINFVFISFKE